jgi:FixJ family two-component response regulator
LRAPELLACQCYVVDQKMPGRSGLGLIDQLRRRNIAAPAILIISQPSTALSVRAANALVPIVEKPLPAMHCSNALTKLYCAHNAGSYIDGIKPGGALLCRPWCCSGLVSL